MIYVSPPCYHVFAYRMNPCLGSLASKTLQPAEPEEPFQPFETFRQDNDEAADAAGSCSIGKDTSSQFTTSALSPSPIRSSTLLSSLSPERNLGASKVGARTMGSETKGILGDVKENAETSKTQNRGTDSAGGESVIGFNGSPQICGGFRGGRGLGARPSPASRLSLVDRKWLERCQVFGEMGAEEKPGAGNQEMEMNVEQRGMAEKGEKLKGEMQGVEREAKEEMDIERERQESLEMGRGKKSESVTGDKIVTTSATNSGKSKKEGVGKEKRKGQEEMERGQTSHITADDDNESSPKTKASKNRRKKRQREVGDTQGNTTEEGGVKKRRRGGRKKEESSDVSPSSAHGGAGKKKRSKRKEGDGEGEGEEETKGPKKARGDLEGALYVLF